MKPLLDRVKDFYKKHSFYLEYAIAITVGFIVGFNVISSLDNVFLGAATSFIFTLSSIMLFRSTRDLNESKKTFAEFKEKSSLIKEIENILDKRKLFSSSYQVSNKGTQDDYAYEYNTLAMKRILTSFYTKRKDAVPFLELIKHIVESSNEAFGESIYETESLGGLRSLANHYSVRNDLSLEGNSRRVETVKTLFAAYGYSLLHWLNFLDLQRDYLERVHGMSTEKLIVALYTEYNSDPGVSEKLPFEWISGFIVDKDLVSKESIVEPLVNMKEINKILEKPLETK